MVLIEDIFNIFFDMSLRELFLFLLDIYLVWLIVYLLFNLIKLNVRTMQLLKGLIFIYIIDYISRLLGLEALENLVDEIIRYGVLALIIIFQPEIRGALEQIGLNSTKNDKNKSEEHTLIDRLCDSIDFLSKRHIGALIVIEQSVKLNEFVTPSTIINSEVSSELLNTIFVPTTPLHDGAVIIRDGKLYCAGAYLPLANQGDISKELGTRHRAAIGVSEISDAITLVVSEETGKISITRNGKISRFETIEEFSEALKLFYSK